MIIADLQPRQSCHSEFPACSVWENHPFQSESQLWLGNKMPRKKTCKQPVKKEATKTKDKKANKDSHAGIIGY